ncbi:MAG: metal ABC transporter substrate-binding protein [Lachnospiraceae bacterium]|nr:metal ABC transporter substrate-binding protein [Lachnospiraceae bacterium]
MKKYLSILFAAILVVANLTACGATGSATSAETQVNDTNAQVAAAEAPENTTETDGKKLQIVTTIFPEYDWVMNVLGDQAENAEVTMLLDNGVDLHSFQPTAEDIMKISTCDLFIYVGGESDGWVEDALQEAVNPNMVVINLLEELGETVKAEEMVEGMQESEHHHDHDHEDEDHDHDEDEHDHEDEDHDHDEDEQDHEDEDHDHDEDEHDHEDEDHDHEEGEEHEHHHEDGEVEYDEHVWLSLRSTATLVASIAEGLKNADATNADAYAANAEAYIAELNALDAEYQAAVDAATVKTVLFGDRFPFRYLVDDYGLTYYAAFVGCSAETEASFETITFLSQKVDELGLKAVLTIEGDNHRIAETIVSNTQSKDQQIMVMDSMQATTSEDVAAGTTYLSVMKANLEVLKAALQ